MKRPARRQSTEVKEYTPVMSGDYNIWYHRYIGYEYHESRKDRGVLTRCCVKTDAGRTRASPTAPICIHFALGNCVRGHECHVCPPHTAPPHHWVHITTGCLCGQYRHCLPTDMDERRVGVTHDVFGRERFKTDRDDMGGVGSFSRENRTLYIGGLNADTSVPECEAIVRRHFGEWGDLEYVRAFPDRGFAFVRYRLRTAAEFAKVAMADQSLDGSETLNVRWAYDDPNPIAKAHEEQAATARFVAAVQQAADDRAAAAKATGAASSTEPPAAKRPAPTVDVPRSTAKVQYKYVFVGKDTPKEGAAATATAASGEKQFSVNPYTHELHPYAQGVYHMRQVREAPRSSSTRAPASVPVSAVAASHQQQQQQKQQQYAAAAAVAVPPPVLPPPTSDEPGFFNDEPLV